MTELAPRVITLRMEAYRTCLTNHFPNGSLQSLLYESFLFEWKLKKLALRVFFSEWKLTEFAIRLILCVLYVRKDIAGGIVFVSDNGTLSTSY